MKGTIWFVILLALLIGGGVIHSRLQQSDEEAAARLMGALRFIEWHMKHASEDILDANPYISPAIEASGSANSFRVAGRVTLVRRDLDGDPEQSQAEPYQAILENLCKPYTDKACWRLHALEIEDAPLTQFAGATKNTGSGEAVEPTETASAGHEPGEATQADGGSAVTASADTAMTQRAATDESVRAPLADGALPVAPEAPPLAAPSRERDIESLLAKRTNSASVPLAEETQAPPVEPASIADDKALPSTESVERATALLLHDLARQQQATEASPFATLSEAARQAERPRAVAEPSPQNSTIAAAAVSETSPSASGSPVEDSDEDGRQPGATEPPPVAAETEPSPAPTDSSSDATSNRLAASMDDKPVPNSDEARAVADSGRAPEASEGQGPTADAAADRPVAAELKLDEPVAAEPEPARPEAVTTADAPEAPRGAEAPLTEAEGLELERGLGRLGFYPGPADGVLDAQSEEAIRAYQDFAALPESGRPDRKLLEEVRLLAATVTVLASDLDGTPAQAASEEPPAPADERPAPAEETLRSAAGAEAKLAEAAPPGPPEPTAPTQPSPVTPLADDRDGEPVQSGTDEPPAVAEETLRSVAGAEAKLAEAAPPVPTVRAQPLPSGPAQRPEGSSPPPDLPVVTDAPQGDEPQIVASLEAKPLAGTPEAAQARPLEVAFTVDSLPGEIRRAIEAGRVDVRLDSGRTPLTEAIVEGRQDAVAALLAHGANPNLSSEDDATALMYAAWAGDAKSVRLLLQAGAEPNRANLDRKTALMAAAATGQAEIVELLLRAGANPDLQALKGWTALMYAVWRDQQEVVRLLLEYDANTLIQNDDEETAVDLAAERNHAGIHTLLVKASGENRADAVN